MSPPLVVASGFAARLLGMAAVPPGHGVLLRARSVHTFGMAGPIGAAGVTAGGRVAWARRVAPRRVAGCGGAVWVVELPPEAALPVPGRRLRVVPRVGPCPAP
ncbi:MAG: hypothetical protein KQH83_09785 [Actinobacteria bacterium]|jgi:hypothetical protein|nr:hypothetical protein [Actinomycetota bacterium]